MGKKQLKMQNS